MEEPADMRKLRLRTDDTEALTALIPILVFIAAFMIITTVVIASMQASFADAQAGNWEYSAGQGLYGDIAYNLWNPAAGFDIEDMTILDRYDSVNGDEETAAREVFYLADPDEADRYMVNVVNDNEMWSFGWVNLLGFTDERRLYDDYIMVAQEYGWFSIAYKAIGYEQIKSAHQAKDGNVSLVPFRIHDVDLTLIVTTPGNATGPMFDTLININMFNIKIGQPASSDFEDISHSSVWNILGQMLTMSLPESNTFIDLLIAVPMWTGLGFAFFIVVRSLVPLLG